MKYLCQVWLDETVMQALSQDERDELDRQSLAYDMTLIEQGHLVTAHPLEGPSSAITLKVRSGQVITTDGPFPEGREHLGGFLLINARDLSEAVRIASGVPIARYGSIEVRQIWDLAERVATLPEKAVRA